MKVFITTKYEKLEISNVDKVVFENDIVTASNLLYVFYDNMTKKHKISLNNILHFEIVDEVEE
jgi:hypothetical protein